MKLLVDCHVFDGKYQGTRTYLEGLYTHLTQNRDIDFYFAAYDVEKLKTVFGESDNITYIQISNDCSVKRLTFVYPQIIRKYRIDYAHFQYITPFLKCCKEIVTIHDLLFIDYPQYFPLLYRFAKKILFKRAALRADILLTVSKYSQEAIWRHFGIDETDIHITYNGILPNCSHKIDVKKKYGIQKYILSVSRIEPRKNYLILLKAFNELSLWDAGYYLVIVGVKDLNYHEFYAYYNSLKEDIKNKIIFLQVPFDDLVALYANASLFVFPSLAEGFGIPPLEALTYGCPLLCSNATAMSEFEFPDVISFNPLDFEELKRKMKDLLTKYPINLQEIRRKILFKYDWAKIADDFYNILEKHRQV